MPGEVNASSGETLEQRHAELSAELRKAAADLRDLRRRYAALYVESQEQAKLIKDYEMSVAALLADQEAIVSSQALAQATAYIRDLRDNQTEMLKLVRQFGQYLETMLDVLQPSTGLRREIEDRFAAVLSVVDRLEQVPSLVAGRDGVNVGTRRQCRVVAVHDQLQIVVLDAGLYHGVRPGMVWRVIEEGTERARVQVIELRGQLCAAMPLSGMVRDIAPGMSARLLEAN
ncbi:MAG: hypothetical protein K9N51_11495 [Candidatus Pacebacteria bacterium]|nr:hypothetical protein [Candidatus Paceibacterota bacterium]